MKSNSVPVVSNLNDRIKKQERSAAQATVRQFMAAGVSAPMTAEQDATLRAAADQTPIPSPTNQSFNDRLRTASTRVDAAARKAAR